MIAIGTSCKERNIRWSRTGFHFFRVFQMWISPSPVNLDSEWFNQMALSQDANWLVVLINVRVQHSLAISLIISSLPGTFNIYWKIYAQGARICSRFLQENLTRTYLMIISWQKLILLFSKISISHECDVMPYISDIVNFSRADFAISISFHSLIWALNSVRVWLNSLLASPGAFPNAPLQVRCFPLGVNYGFADSSLWITSPIVHFGFYSNTLSESSKSIFFSQNTANYSHNGDSEKWNDLNPTVWLKLRLRATTIV
jgi:hypothetical protein